MRNKASLIKYKNGEYFPFSWQDIVLDEEINIYDFDTIVPLLKILDYPAIKSVWNETLNSSSTVLKNPGKVLPRYIMKMHLKQYALYSFKDSWRWKESS